MSEYADEAELSWAEAVADGLITLDEPDKSAPETVTLPVAVLAGILASADGYCYVCAGDLADRMKRVDPMRDWPKLIKEAS